MIPSAGIWALKQFFQGESLSWKLEMSVQICSYTCERAHSEEHESQSWDGIYLSQDLSSAVTLAQLKSGHSYLKGEPSTTGERSVLPGVVCMGAELYLPTEWGGLEAKRKGPEPDDREKDGSSFWKYKGRVWISSQIFLQVKPLSIPG